MRQRKDFLTITVCNTGKCDRSASQQVRQLQMSSANSHSLSAGSLFALLRGDFFAAAMFMALLLIGADLIAITAGELTLRLVFPFLMVAGAFLYMQQRQRIALDLPLTVLFILLAIGGALSAVHSYDTAKSVGYTVWVLFDYFVIITLCYNLARRYEPGKILMLWFGIYRIHVFALLAELAWRLAHASLGRPHLWFYESSFLAIFMTGYFGSALYMMLRTGKFRFDFVLAVAGMLATTSATGIFGMIFAVIINFIVARQRVKLLLSSATIAVIFLATLYVFFQHTAYYQLVASFLLRPGLSFGVVFARGGDRLLRVLTGWSAFLHHPWLGVGIGGDAAYMRAEGVPENAHNLVNQWAGVERGQPFSNIVVEVMGTMGIAGLVPFLAILIYAIWTMGRMLRDENMAAAVALFIGFFSIFLALQFESTFLRYYLWSPLGLAFGSARWFPGFAAQHAPTAAAAQGPVPA